MIKAVSVFICAAIAGAVAGWRPPETEPVHPIIEAVPAVPSVPLAPKWGKDDFIGSIKKRTENLEAQGQNPLESFIQDWSNEEIRMALEEALKVPERMMDFGGGGCNALFGEWLKRDFDSALGWYEGLEFTSYQIRLAECLSFSWPPGRSAEGLRFVMENREIFPHNSCWKLVILNLEAETLKGPDAVGKLLADLSKNEFDLESSEPLVFPEGFDFQKLGASEGFQELGMNTVAGQIVVAWFQQDREAAFSWMLAEKGAKAIPLLMPIPYGLSKENLEWVSSKLANIPAAERTEFFKEVEISWAYMPFPALAMLRATGDPALLTEIRATALQAMFAGEVDQLIPMIESIPDPAERVQLLAGLERSKLFESRPDLLRFQPHNEAALRAKLSAWKATEAEITAIVTKFQP